MKKVALLLSFVLINTFLLLSQVADFTANQTTICVGGSVQFIDLSSGNTTWSWIFNDGGSGQTSNVPNPNITYPNPGTYTVTLVVSNGVSNDTRVRNGYITVLPAATVTLTSGAGSDNQMICQNSPMGTPITYTVVGASGATFNNLPPGVNGTFTPTATGGTVTISGTPTGTGVFNYDFTTNGSNCAPIITNGAITVQQAHTLVLTSAPGTDNQIVCYNTPMVDITYQFGGSATSASASGLPPGVTQGVVGNTLTISGTPTQPGTYNYSVTTSGGICPPVTLTGTIDVNPTLVLTSVSGTDNQIVCINNPILDIEYTFGGGATGVDTLGFPTGLSTSTVGNVFTISGSPNIAGTYNYTVSTSGGACPAYSLTGSLVVQPLPTISLTSAPATANQSICQNSPLTNITYAIGGSATNAFTTGPLPAGLSGSYSMGTFTISGTPTATPGVYAYTVMTAGSICPPETLSGTITIDQAPTLTLTSAVGTDNQAICLGSPIVDIEYTIGGGATSAIANTLPAGLSTSFSGGVLTISGTPTTPGNNAFSVSTVGGACPGITLPVALQVDTPPTLTLSSAPGSDFQTVCENEAMGTPITYTVGGGATSASASGLPAGVTGVFSAGVLTISGTPTAQGSFAYTVTTIGGACTPAATASGNILVEPGPTLTLTSAAGTDNQTICVNTAIVPIDFTFGGSATGATASGLPAGVSSSVSGNILTISGTPTVTGPFNFTVSTTGGSCLPITLNGTILIESTHTLTIVPPASTATQTVCVNAPIVDIHYVFGGGATGATTSALPSGITSTVSNDTLTITGTPTVSGSFPITITSTGGACPGVTANVSLTIETLPTLVLSSAAGTDNQTVCLNTAITPIDYTFGGSATGATVIGLPAGVTSTVAGSVLTISGTPTVSGPFNYTVSTTGGTCTPVSLNGTIQVEPIHTLTIVPPINTDTQTVCINTSIANIRYVFGGGATGATAMVLPTGVSASVSNDTITISGSPTVAGIFPITVSTAGGACPAVTANVLITVENSPVVTLTSAVGTDNQTVCIDSTLVPIVYSITGAATGASATGLPPGVIFNYSAGTFTISGIPTVAGNYPYTITTSGGSCPNATTTGTIDVLPSPTITLTSAPATTSQTVCINTPITDIEYTVGGSATGATSTGLPAGVTGSFAAGVYTLSGSPSVAGTFNYKAITTGGGCKADTLAGQIIVAPSPTLSLTSAAATSNQTVCENVAINNIVYSFGGGATGVSLSGQPAGVTGNTSAGTFTISGTPTVAGNYTYTVTTTGGTCPAISLTGTINVDAAPTLTLTSAPGTNNQTVCQNASITDITYSLVGGATGATISGLPPGVNGALSAGIYTISGTPGTAGTYNYTITTTGGTCPPVSVNGTITVQNTVITLVSASYTNNQSICIGNAIDTIKYNMNGLANVTDLPPGVSWTYTPGTPGVVIIFGTPTASGSFFYTVQSSGICGNATVVGSIIVVPDISSNSSGNDVTTCQGTNFAFTGSTLPSAALAYNYLWQSSVALAGPYTPASGVNTSANYSGTATFANNNRYFRRVVTIGNCTDTAAPVLLTVDSLPTLLTSGNSIICSNDTLLVTSVSGQNGTVSNWTTDGFGQLLNANTAQPTYIPGPSDAGQTIHLFFEVNSNNTCAPAKVNGTYTVKINPDPVAVAGGSTTVCAYGAEVLVTGTMALNGTPTWIHGGNGTLLSPNSINPTYITVPADAGTTVSLLMMVSNTQCTTPLIDTAYYTILVKADSIDAGINVYAGLDTSLSLGHSVQLNGSGVGIVKWIWTPSYGLSDTTISNPIANPEASLSYILTGINAFGCADRDTVYVKVSEEADVFVPNLFSPNGDGMNDTFEIPELKYYPNTAVTIINREGVVVYQSKAYDNSWDGNYQGQKLPEATYYYLIEFQGQSKVYKGAITLLRNEN